MDSVDSGEGPRRILAPLTSNDGAPRTTVEIADAMNIDRETARTRLETLAELGYVDSRPVCDSHLWWGTEPVDDVTGERFDGMSGLPAIVYRRHQEDDWRMDHIWGDCEAITGYATEALERGDVGYDDDVVHPDDRARLRDVLDADRERGDSFTLQYRIVTRAGETRWVLERGRSCGDGTLVGVIADVDEQTHVEAELEGERAFVESIFDAQQDVVYAFDRDGRMHRWNDRLNQVTGYSDDEISEMHALDFVAPEQRDRVQSEFASVLIDGEHATVEFRALTKNGDEIPYEITAAPIRERGDISGVTGIARDISSRIERERELQQQRDELESELSEIFERVDDAFFALDDDWRFTYVNEQATEVLERDEAELLGRRIWEEFPEAIGSQFEEEYRRAMETQEPASFESFYDPLDRWFEVNAHPSESGLSVYFRDITERKARTQSIERTNRRYRTLIENFPNGAVTLYDTDLVCQAAGGENVARVGLSEAEMIGEYVGDFLPEPWASELVDQYSAALEGERQRFEVEDDGRIFDVQAIPVRDDDGEVFGVLGMSQDVTARREYERELEHYETLANTAADVLVRIDTDSTIRDINPAVSDVFGYDPAELHGERLTKLMPERLRGRHLAGLENYLETDERTLDWNYIELPAVRADGTEIHVAISFSEYEHRGERFFTGIIRDISERKKREEALQAVYEVIIDADRTVSEKLDELLAVARSAIDMPFGTISFVTDDTYTFEYVDVPEEAGIEADMQVSRETLPNCSYVVSESETLVLRDVAAEAPELDDPTWSIQSYLGAPVVVDGEVYGTFCFYDVEPREEEFSDWEVTFVELLSNWVGYALDRERTTEQLEALNSLHNTVREITHAAFNQSTREEIESAACEFLADSPSYEFAWIADHNPRIRSIEARTAAGTHGYESEVEISLQDGSAIGPTARAFKTHEVQAVQNVFEDPDYEPWRDLALKYGFQSSAAIPIVHEESIYGVLNVYAARPNGFEGRELDVLAQLGEILGHAIASAERKRALMSDELVELEFAIDDVFTDYLGGDSSTDRIVIKNAIPTGDDEFLLYGFVEGSSIEPVERLVDQIPHWTSVNVVSGDDPIRFEVSLTEPPVLTSIASMGGAVHHAEIVDGDYFMRVRLPREANVRRVIESVKNTYPDAGVLTHRQVTRNPNRSLHLQSAWSESLTDKQRTALEAAFHAGYFSWPRDASGEDLADSLGVSPPTFYQHLRAAEAKLFAALLDDEDDSV